MIGNRFYTWFKNYYQWVGGAFNETLLLPLVRATAGLRAGAIRYDETTNTVETYDGTNWNAIPSASGFVPYTGATQDVNLGEQGLEAGYLQLDTTPTGTPTDQGTIYWDIDAETAALIMNGTVQKVGEDVFFHVQNKTGSPIPKGTAVRFAGTDGNSGKILIAPFLANGTYPSQYFMGVTAETIADQAFGKVYHFGKIRGVNTQAYNAGDILYASTSVAGGFQTTPPVAPNNIIVVAAVISKANNGTLMVRSTFGSNINNDEGVLISSAANGQGLFYENGLWKNKTIATVLGYTPGTVSSVGIVTGSAGTDINVSGSPVTVSGNITLNIPTASATNRGALSAADWTTFNNKVSASRQLTINGTAFDLSADRSWSVGTVTSVAASAPLSVSGSATTTPVITITQANSTTNGFLSSTDWNTFNNKQNALSLTTTGNSGASTLIGATINVPEYTLSGLGGVPTTRTLTINGTALDLSANRSWSVGTVTSVGLTSSTSGVTISDSLVTVSGTIGIAIATANGSQQGLLSGTDWTTFNNKQNAITLTTTGTSGAASLIGATLNIPEYQAQGNYITSLTGEATASGPGAASVTLSTTAVTGKLLTGLNLSGGGTIAATDSILTAFGKVQNQISAMVGGVMYQGTWNASTNTPTLTSSVGTKGNYYIVDVSGTTNLNGITDWRVGDWAIFNGSTWDKVDNTDAVSSVNGFTGAVSLTTSHIAEGTNLYYLDSRSRTAISLTTTGNSGAATYDNVSGIINVPQYTLAGLGGVPTTRQLTINGTAFDLSADRSWSVGTVTSVGLNSTTSGITITNTPVTGSGALTINIATASGSQNGLLSSTDWNTFNNKQNALTNPVTGTGVSGQVAFFNGTTTITSESNLFWDATNNRLSIGNPSPSPVYTLEVAGDAFINSNLFIANASQLRFSSNAIYAKAELVGGQIKDLAFYTNSTERLRITESGNLGLGTSSPTAATAGRRTQVIRGTSSELILQSSNATDGTSVGITYTAAGNDAYFVNRLDGFFAWITGGAGNTQRMLLDASGNLGLGVTPSAWGSAYKAIQIAQSSFAGATLYSWVGNNWVDDGSGNKYIANGFSTLYEQRSGEHRFLTAPSGTAGNAITFTQAMTLDASGRLGIGTTSPAARLHISSNAASPSLIINNASSGWSFSQWEFNATPYGYIGQANSTFSGGSATDFGIRAENNLTFGVGSNERMRLNSSGNLGLGVTPSAWGLGKAIEVGNIGNSVWGVNTTQFNVLQNAYHDAGGYKYATSNAASYYQQASGTHAWYNAASGTAGNAISFTQAMTLDSSGRLLVGTNTAGTSNQGITVYSAGQGEIRLQSSGTGTGTANGFQVVVDGNTSYLWNLNNFPIVLGTNNTERMRITSGGAVQLTGTIQTGGISGGSAVPWKLGNAVSGAPASPTITIEVEINGSVYQIGASTV